MKGFVQTSGLCLCVAAFSACSSGSASRNSETATTAGLDAVSETVLLIDDRGLVARGFDNDAGETIEGAIEYGGDRWPSPDRKLTALTTTRADTQYLTLVGYDGSYLNVHQLPGSQASYSVVWSPTSDSLLIGFDGPEKRGIAIFALKPGILTDVGCSASSVALSWGREDWFVVGDRENHYVVDRTDCETIELLDARKLHEVTFAQHGNRVAYILRELEYDSKTRQYQPDSSLYIANSYGDDPILVAGDRYRPHRPRWSADALSLAFDARLPDEPERRLISVYDIESGMASVLNPEAVKSKSSEWDPHWSPTASAIAYLQSSKGKPPVVTVRTLSNSFTTVVGTKAERLVGWLGDDKLILQGDLATRIVGVDGKELLVIEGTPSVIGMREALTNGSN